MTLDGFQTALLATRSTLPADSACNLVLTRSTLQNGNVGVRAYGCAVEGTTAAVSVAIGTNASDGNTFSNFVAPASTYTGTAIELGGCVSRSKIIGNAIRASEIGIWSQRYALAYEAQDAFDVERNSFEGSRNAGIHLWGSSTIRVLRGNSFLASEASQSVTWSGSGLALDTNGGERDPAVLLARENRFIGNEVGFVVRNRSTRSSGAPTDFGTAADPGHNVFRCNSSAIHALGFDFLFHGNTVLGAPISLVGNAWDHAPVTSSATSAASRGTDVVVSWVDPGVIDASGSTVSTEACPAGSAP